MAIEIKKVTTLKELKRFIRFNYLLYKDNPYSVPDLLGDMLRTFNKKINAAFEFCEADYFMAYKDGKPVGRVAAIINRRVNEQWNIRAVRFGWIDFIDDVEVSGALLKTVEEWGRERGMTTIQGPLGFTDMDAEGMLVEGFDQLSTMATIYNYPYYVHHMDVHGYTKATDWVEYKIRVPKQEPEKYKRIASIVMQKYELSIKKYKSSRKIAREYGRQIFELINESYAQLYGYSELTKRQIMQYVKMYLPVLDLDLVTLVTDKAGQLVAVGISMPSLSVALQRAKGKIFPFGWYHLLKSLYWKHPDTLDLLLIAVKPSYQNKGINGLLFFDLIPIYNKKGYIWAESNPELELNEAVQRQWEYFEYVQHKRRRAFIKQL